MAANDPQTANYPSSANGGAVAAVPPMAITPLTPEQYKEYLAQPELPWPPPIFVRKNITAEQKYYIENRWYSQWKYYDKKANENKQSYLFYQRIIVIGSVTVPVLVSIGPSVASYLNNEVWVRALLDMSTVVISLAVAISAAVEGLYKYGDYWRNYRQAAEELVQEKHLYDVNSGAYANSPDPFLRFVERCEGIIAKQNGQYFQTVEKQQAEAAKQNAEILEAYSNVKGPEELMVNIGTDQMPIHQTTKSDGTTTLSVG